MQSVLMTEWVTFSMGTKNVAYWPAASYATMLRAFPTATLYAIAKFASLRGYFSSQVFAVRAK